MLRGAELRRRGRRPKLITLPAGPTRRCVAPFDHACKREGLGRVLYKASTHGLAELARRKTGESLSASGVGRLHLH